jgi:hypothetical protein
LAGEGVIYSLATLGRIFALLVSPPTRTQQGAARSHLRQPKFAVVNLAPRDYCFGPNKFRSTY